MSLTSSPKLFRNFVAGHRKQVLIPVRPATEVLTKQTNEYLGFASRLVLCIRLLYTVLFHCVS